MSAGREMLRTSAWRELTRIEMARTVAGRPLHTVSAFHLGDTLVDSGCPATAGELAGWAEDREVRRVVHTHHHEDHIGGDAELRRRFGADVLAGPRTAAILRDVYRLPLYRRVVWGQPESVPARAVGSTVEIAGDEWRVVPTPGHAADHVCFFSPRRRWVFTGDLFITRRVSYLRAVEDAHEILRSLRRVRDLAPEVVFCSHAGVVEDAPQALDDRIRFWTLVTERAADLVAQGASLRRARRELLGREGPMTLISVGDFSKANLLRSLLAGGPGALV